MLKGANVFWDKVDDTAAVGVVGKSSPSSNVCDEDVAIAVLLLRIMAEEFKFKCPDKVERVRDMVGQTGTRM